MEWEYTIPDIRPLKFEDTAEFQWNDIKVILKSSRRMPFGCTAHSDWHHRMWFEVDLQYKDMNPPAEIKGVYSITLHILDQHGAVHHTLHSKLEFTEDCGGTDAMILTGPLDYLPGNPSWMSFSLPDPISLSVRLAVHFEGPVI